MRTRKNKRQTLRNTYGTVTLPKGLILYHTSSAVFDPKIRGSMIFFTFHPSEWAFFRDDVTTKVELTKPVRLFFMVKTIYRQRIISLIHIIKNSNTIVRGHLYRHKDINLDSFIPYLTAENLDGWFTTVCNQTAVDVALINDSSYYKVLSTERTNREMSLYPEYKENLYYPLYTLQFPIKLHIHKKYKAAIDDYVRMGDNFAFQIILENAQIEYFDGPDKDILWNCPVEFRDRLSNSVISCTNKT
jgi:hypothetical protein